MDSQNMPTLKWNDMIVNRAASTKSTGSPGRYGHRRLTPKAADDALYFAKDMGFMVHLEREGTNRARLLQDAWWDYCKERDWPYIYVRGQIVHPWMLRYYLHWDWFPVGYVDLHGSEVQSSLFELKARWEGALEACAPERKKETFPRGRETLAVIGMSPGMVIFTDRWMDPLTITFDILNRMCEAILQRTGP